MPARKNPPCEPCREKHQKCDRAIPSCGNCRKTSHFQCTYPSNNAGLQVESAGGAIGISGSFMRYEARSLRNPGRRECLSTQSPSSVTFSHDEPDRSESRLLCEPAPTGSLVPSPPIAPVTALDTVEQPLSGRGLPAEADTPIPMVITEDMERMVFESYLEHFSHWLDDVSPEQHFGRIVPRLSLSEPVLFYACLAFAANVMVLWGKLDKAVPERFQDKAIGLLIPLLSAPMTVLKSEILLSTTVLLHMIEQVSEIGKDEQRHLKGAYSLLFTNMSFDRWDPLQADQHRPTFWNYVRLTLRFCFLNEQGCPLDLGLCRGKEDDDDDDGEALFASAPDEVWTNRMSYLLARLCNACWAERNETVRTAKLMQLSQLIDRWRRSLPNNFMPWYLRQTDFEPFPTVRYLCPWHVVAWQQYHTARVMLAVYTTERPDGNMLSWNHSLTHIIQTHARQACAACFGCQNVGASINGTHLISWCGQFFTGKEEQRRLLTHLGDFMKRTEFPNRTCIERLKAIWSGERGSWIKDEN